MALFFDAEWFDARLAERSLSRAVLAAAAGLSEADLALVLKDQRELSAGQVSAIAELLGVTPAEVADRAGVATPVPGRTPEARLAELERRVAALEAEISKLLSPECSERGRGGQISVRAVRPLRARRSLEPDHSTRL